MNFCEKFIPINLCLFLWLMVKRREKRVWIFYTIPVDRSTLTGIFFLILLNKLLRYTLSVRLSKNPPAFAKAPAGGDQPLLRLRLAETVNNFIIRQLSFLQRRRYCVQEEFPEHIFHCAEMHPDLLLLLLQLRALAV